MMMLADARLPVGGHVHSAGLEPALVEGRMPPARVHDYMLGRASTVSLVEAATAVVARHSVLSVRAPLAGVEAAWSARTPSRALREVSRSLGRGYLRLALSLWPGHPAIEACVASAPFSVPFSRPVVLGAIAAAAGLDAVSLVRLVIYDDAQTVGSALLKLDPIDPAITTGWVMKACASVEDFVPALAALTSPEAIPAFGAPQSEVWAEAHSLSTKRLFRA
jgi:urease accessory protein